MIPTKTISSSMVFIHLRVMVMLAILIIVATPLWAKCEGEAHTPKSGKLESSETPKNSERDFRSQISLHLCAFDVIGKVLKCRCPKWPRMSHLDIQSPSYGQKKGIDLFPTCAPGVQHGVGKLSLRATSLV
jgi:hypothetical protein